MKKLFCGLLAVLMFSAVLAVAAGMAATTEAADYGDMAGKRIGVQTGSINGPIAEASFPNAQVDYFNSLPDPLTALKTDKLDALVVDQPIVRFMNIDNPGLEIVGEPLSKSNLAAAFPKTESGQALRDQYSAFIDDLWESVVMAQIDDTWFGTDESRRTVLDYENLPDTNGTQEIQGGQTDMDFQTMYFEVERIDGDYASLRRTDARQEESTLVARALLPESIREGTKLKYEMLQYSVIG